uniref:Capsid protein n=1 Tax=Cruciviridae sp. TaxID=1955495 RepID=A0A1S6LVK3_9VIRU|nr:capsid protein [Cruciviridae sp.]
MPRVASAGMVARKPYKKAKKVYAKAYPKSGYVARAPRPMSTSKIVKSLGHRAVDFGIDKLSKFFGSVLGSGDYVQPSYSVKKNVLTNLSQQVPEVKSEQNSSSVKFRHREYLGDIISSSVAGNFKIQSFNINPGNRQTFPWLADSVQTNFQKWSPKGIVFEYRTMSADALNSTNTALGTVIMATNYSSVDAAYTSKQQMENTEFSASCKPSQSMLHPIECDPRQLPLQDMYILNGSESGTFDPRFDNLGTFYIATQGMQGTSVNCGELWASYDIDVLTPIQNKPLSNGQAYQVVIDFANVTNSVLLGTSARKEIINNMGVTISGNVLTIPAGQLINRACYTLLYYMIGASTPFVTAPSIIITGGGVAGLGVLQNQTSGSTSAPYTSPATSGLALFIQYFECSDPTKAVTMTFSSSVIPTSLVGVDLNIFQISGALAAS